MPRLFLPNIAAGVIPKDVNYPSLEIQAVVPARVSISSRTRCEKADALSSIPYSSSFRHPVFHTLPHFGIHLLVVIVQNYLHSLQYLCFAMQRYEENL